MLYFIVYSTTLFPILSKLIVSVLSFEGLMVNSIASTMACPNFKNGPKKGLGFQGLNLSTIYKNMWIVVIMQGKKYDGLTLLQCLLTTKLLY